MTGPVKTITTQCISDYICNTNIHIASVSPPPHQSLLSTGTEVKMEFSTVYSMDARHSSTLKIEYYAYNLKYKTKIGQLY